MLTKMSVAVFATFFCATPARVFAADNLAAPASAPILANMVNGAKASSSALAFDVVVMEYAAPNYLMASAFPFAATTNANLAMSKASAVLPTVPEAQGHAAEDIAVRGASALIANSALKPEFVVDSFFAASIAQSASSGAHLVARAFESVPLGVKAPSNQDETTIRAEQMTGRPSRVLNFDGQVEIVRGLSTIDSDTAEYHGVEDLVMANHNVQMYRNLDCYSGDTLEMQMDTGEGFLINPVYKLEKNNAQGFAKRMNFIDNDRSQIERGSYTTCEGTKPDWYMLSSRLDLDTGRDEGVAYDGIVYFQEVPILAAPWLSFPISDKRRSGVLPPEFYTTTTGGPEFALPYYFDIAPNRDATVIPAYIEKRGEQLGGEFRYLDTTYFGLTHAEITPSDQDDNGKTRYSISSTHNETLLPGLRLTLNYNRASDDQYAIDYSHSITQSSQHLLPQILTLDYATSPLWGVGLAMTNYQVLQDANNDIGKPYEIMPKLYGNLSRIDDHGFDWSSYTEYANFLNSNPNTVYGERLVEQAQISYPIVGTYYFVTPKLLYHASEYKLTPNDAVYISNYANAGNGTYFQTLTPYKTDPSISVPTLSLDSGLFFERDASLFGHDLIQTLEPRLFYVRTPYRYQADVPNFDTSLADVNFAQIFSENRFAGQDRVSDANQLTAALISRAIEMDGQERMRFALAQRVSFTQPLVVDSPYFYSTNLNGVISTTQIPTLPSKADLIFAASGKITDTLFADAGWQYSQTYATTQQMNYGFKWQPGPMQVINAEYRFQHISEVDPEGMKQIDVSGQWPIAPRWYAVGRSNFSIQDHRILDGLAGVEYKQDCWIFRFVAQRYLVPSTVAGITSSSTTSLFFQLELNGLSKIGSNPLEVLKRNIAGYQPVNQPITQQSYQQNNY